MRRLTLGLIAVVAVIGIACSGSKPLSGGLTGPSSSDVEALMNTLDTEWPKNMGDALRALPEGHGFSVPDVLFKKIADEEREDWQERFAGVR